MHVARISVKVRARSRTEIKELRIVGYLHADNHESQLQKLVQCARKIINRTCNAMMSDEHNLYNAEKNSNDTRNNVTIAHTKFDMSVVTLARVESIALHLREGCDATFDCNY